MTSGAQSDRDREFALAEFVQLHEHIRQQDNSMVQILTVLLVSSTALISASGGYVFQRIADSEPIAVPISYLFLAPILILLPGLAMLRAHRRNIYRMGTFVRVFLENPPHGAQWHQGLAEFRTSDKGESLDHVPLTIWTLAGLSVALFSMALVVSGAEAVHWFVPIPLLVLIGIGHGDFADAKSGSAPEAEWQRVRASLRQATPPQLEPLTPDEPLQPTAPVERERRG